MAAGLAAGAVAAAPWGAFVVRCDDDDDDKPMTPKQKSAAAKIEALNKAASNRTLTPMMALCMAAGLTWPLSMSLKQGMGSLRLSAVSLVCTVPALYAVVGMATRTSKKDIAAAMDGAKKRETPSLLLGCTLVGFAFPAAQVAVATGEIATAVTAALTGLAGAFGLFFVVVDTAEEARSQEEW